MKIALELPEPKRSPIQKYLNEKLGGHFQPKDEELLAAFPEYQEKATRWRDEIAKLEAGKVRLPRVRALTDTEPVAEPYYLLKRGEAYNRGGEALPDVPAVLSGGTSLLAIIPPWPGAPSTGRRLAFARWLTRPDHPLTARVFVGGSAAARSSRPSHPPATSARPGGPDPSRVARLARDRVRPAGVEHQDSTPWSTSTASPRGNPAARAGGRRSSRRAAGAVAPSEGSTRRPSTTRSSRSPRSLNLTMYRTGLRGRDRPRGAGRGQGQPRAPARGHLHAPQAALATLDRDRLAARCAPDDDQLREAAPVRRLLSQALLMLNSLEWMLQPRPSADRSAPGRGRHRPGRAQVAARLPADLCPAPRQE